MVWSSQIIIHNVVRKGIVGRIFFLHTSFVCIKFDICPPLLYTVVFMRFLAPSFVDCWNCLKLPHSKTGLTIHIPYKPYAYSSGNIEMNTICIFKFYISDTHRYSQIYNIQIFAYEFHNNINLIKIRHV